MLSPAAILHAIVLPHRIVVTLELDAPSEAQARVRIASLVLDAVEAADARVVDVEPDASAVLLSPN